MAISEDQFDTWSKQGTVPGSAQTYQTIRDVLNDSNASYHARDYSIFLQGSYGNDTNVYSESDVDIVICLNQTYSSDTSALKEEAKGNYDKAFSAATYGWEDFRTEVLAWLQAKYGAAVAPGKKAIAIKANGSRRDADVIVCTQFRRYWETSTGTDNDYAKGICFWSDGKRINNYPKQHSENCTKKHQDTNSWFKPTVRIYKNMRNRMIKDGVLKPGLAPSYFIEGMLWNVPDDKFGTNYVDTFIATYNFIVNADKSKLTTASRLHWLVRDSTHTSWPTANIDAYLAATKKYWDGWGK